MRGSYLVLGCLYSSGVSTLVGNNSLGTSTKWCCVHTLSSRHVTVYIVTPLHPVGSHLKTRAWQRVRSSGLPQN